jgi:hypothetical protein
MAQKKFWAIFLFRSPHPIRLVRAVLPRWLDKPAVSLELAQILSRHPPYPAIPTGLVRVVL